MNNNKNTNEKNWTWIGCVGLVAVVAAYSLTTIRIASITEDYRNTLIAQYMHTNDILKKKECDLPVSAYISYIKRTGITTDGRNEIDMVDTVTRERCEAAQAKISENKDKMKKVIHVKPTFSHIAENFFK